MGAFPKRRAKYRVTISGCGCNDSCTDFSDYDEAREYYESMWRSSSTGESVDFSEVSGEDESPCMIVVHDEIPEGLGQNDFRLKPTIGQLEQQRGHKCHWDHRGMCIRCRKPRPFWS